MTEYRKGLLLGLGAYVIWGLVPLYFKLMTAVPPVEIVAHRIVWSVVLLVGGLALAGKLDGLARVFADAKLRRMLALSAVLIAINWLIYIWAVVEGKLLAASLGYFLNPLLNVAIGVAVLGEKLTRAAKVAVAIAGVGVAVAAAGALDELWVSLALALSFAFYGLVRKLAPVGAVEGLAAETLILGVPCLVALGWFWHDGSMAMGQSVRIDALLIASSVVTSLPLILFAGAARRLPYATVGLLQYLAPSMVFVMGVTLFGETLRPAMLVAFLCIWVALAIFTVDLLRGLRSARA